MTRRRLVGLRDRRPWTAARVTKGPRKTNLFFRCLFCGKIGSWKALLLGPPCCQASDQAPDNQAVLVTASPKAFQKFQLSKLHK